MQAKKCDRCGAYYDKNVNSFGTASAPLVSVGTNTLNFRDNSFDLCDECMKKFLYDFMLLRKDNDA